jgi:transcriptional regulator with XRE-family HTH domain
MTGRVEVELPRTMYAPESIDQTLALAIRRLRQERGYTQEELAYGAGITVAALARIERGRASPQWTTVRRIIGALGVSLSELSVEVEHVVV